MDIFTTKSMSNKSPIFPIPQHFTDYGFEPQIDYFQVLEEARRHKRESSIDVHFKLQKPISRDESSKKIKKSKKRWWRSALLLFFKFPKRAPPAAADHGGSSRIGSISGPIYATESRSGGSTPCYRSGPLGKGGDGMPYLSLREVNAAETPIYLVT